MKINPAEYNCDIVKSLLAETSPLYEKRVATKMRLATKLDNARKELSWSKTDMALKFKRQPSVITKWLSGTHNFTLDTIVEIEEIMGLKLISMEERVKTPVKQFTAYVTGMNIINEPHIIFGMGTVYAIPSVHYNVIHRVELTENNDFRIYKKND